MTRTVLLGDIVYPVSDTMKFSSEEVIFLNTSDIEAGKFLHKNLSVPKTLPGQAKKKIQKDDILFSEIRPANKRYAYVGFSNTEKYVVSTKLMILRAKEGAYPKFVYHWITAPQQLSTIQTIAESRSGTFPQITFDTIKNLRVNLPDYQEQQKIAKFIDDIDEKIELNRKMNETLEQIGQALFRHYFIDNPEAKKWENGTADNLFVLTMGLSPKGESYNSDGDGMLLLNGAADFTGASITPKRHTSSPTRVSKPGDVIFCIRGTIGNVCIGYQNYCLGRGVAAMTPLENATSYVYFSTIHAIAEMESAAAGSVIRGLSKDDIAKRKVKLPPTMFLDDFEAKVLPLIKKIRINSEEIQTLTTLRDTLLPRLISGKLKV